MSAGALAGGWDDVRRRGAEAVFLGEVAGMGTLFTSVYLIPELSGAVGGLAATAAFLGLRWRRLSRVEVPFRALLPYAFLFALLALANGVGVLGELLGRLGPVFVGPGLPLLISCAFAAVLLGLNKDETGTALRSTVGQWLPTAGAVLTFVLAGEVLAASGTAALLASGALAFGGWNPVVAPVVGALGGVLTGSNAASNALFMPLQAEAARGWASRRRSRRRRRTSPGATRASSRPSA